MERVQQFRFTPAEIMIALYSVLLTAVRGKFINGVSVLK